MASFEEKYDVIRLLNNPGLAYGKWRELSLIAVNNNMKTNVFYLRQLPAFFYSLPRGSLKTATVA